MIFTFQVVAYWRFKFEYLGMTPSLPIPPTEEHKWVKSEWKIRFLSHLLSDFLLFQRFKNK